MELIMPFLVDGSSSFVNGFECGQIFELAGLGRKFDEYIAHESNRMQIEEILLRHGYVFRIEKINDTFCAIYAESKAEFN